MADRSTYPSEQADKYLLRLPDGMRERLKDAAKENNRSMNAEIVARLEQSFLTKVQADGTNEVSMSRGEYQALMSRLDSIGALLGGDPVPLSAEAQDTEAKLKGSDSAT